MKKSHFGNYIIILLIILLCFFYFKNSNYFNKSEGNRNYNWGLQSQIDYPNNDIASYPNITVTQCMDECFDRKGCVGIVTEQRAVNELGMCWLKSKLGSNNKITATNPKRFSRIRP
jgi:hypothetical protein